jgi:hypothetical protein
VTERRESVDQLDLFRQPPTESEGDAAVRVAPVVAPSEKPRKTQMSKLAGETWEDAFGDAA